MVRPAFKLLLEAARLLGGCRPPRARGARRRLDSCSRGLMLSKFRSSWLIDRSIDQSIDQESRTPCKSQGTSNGLCGQIHSGTITGVILSKLKKRQATSPRHLRNPSRPSRPKEWGNILEASVASVRRGCQCKQRKRRRQTTSSSETQNQILTGNERNVASTSSETPILHRMMLLIRCVRALLLYIMVLPAASHHHLNGPTTSSVAVITK